MGRPRSTTRKTQPINQLTQIGINVSTTHLHQFIAIVDCKIYDMFCLKSVIMITSGDVQNLSPSLGRNV